VAAIGADGKSIQITDTTGGGGNLIIKGAPGTEATGLGNAAKELGIYTGAAGVAGSTVNGDKVLGGLESVMADSLNGGDGLSALAGTTLFASLFGGSGIAGDTNGLGTTDLSIQDRSGATAEFDLDAYTTVQEFIDAVNGDDVNDGATAATALASWGELVERLGPNPVLGDVDVTITLLSSLSESIAFDGAITIQPRRVLTIVGTQSVIFSSTFTGTTPINRAANTPQQVEDTSFAAWDTAGPGGTSLLGNKAIMTGGANTGAEGWLDIQDPGGVGTNVARTQGWMLGGSASAPTTDEYDVVELVSVDSVQLDCRCADSNGALILRNFRVADPDASGFANNFAINFPGGAFTMRLDGMEIEAAWIRLGVTNVFATNCYFNDNSIGIVCSGTAQFSGCLFGDERVANGAAVKVYNGELLLNSDTLVHGRFGVEVGAFLNTAGGAGFFGGGTMNAIEVEPQAVFGCGNAGLYGSNYARIIELQPGAGATFQINPPTAVSSNDPNNTVLGDGTAIPYSGGAPDWANGAAAAGSYVAERI